MSVDWNIPPAEIETRSFTIIDAEASEHDWPPEAWRIIRRMIHTTADFEWIKSVRLHPHAIRKGIEALRSGKTIVTDTRMAQAGIGAGRLKPFGVKVECLIDYPGTVREAGKANATRAATAVDQALSLFDVGIYVVGNAPTALFRLIERLEEKPNGPDLIVGLPVGFVNAAESKEALLKCSTAYITNVGRKGGSAVAASVINALAEMAGEDWLPKA